jgi:hypothetical protein
MEPTPSQPSNTIWLILAIILGVIFVIPVLCVGCFVLTILLDATNTWCLVPGAEQIFYCP